MSLCYLSYCTAVKHKYGIVTWKGLSMRLETSAFAGLWGIAEMTVLNQRLLMELDRGLMIN